MGTAWKSALVGMIALTRVARAAVPAPPSTGLHPFTAFAWVNPNTRLPHLVPMIPVGPGVTPYVAARSAAEYPPDQRVLLLLGLPNLIWNNPGDTVVGKDGKRYQGPWLDHGAAAAGAWFSKFLAAFQFARGTAQFVAQDDEIGVGMWAVRQPQVDAIAADPRWKPFAARIGDVSRACDIGAWPVGARYDDAVNAIIASYVQRAVLDPLQHTFPGVGTSEWADTLIPPAVESQAPDLNGWIQPTSVLFGNVGSPPFYGDVAGLTRNSKADFDHSPLPTVCYFTSNARAFRKGSQTPLLPWFAGQGYAPSRLRISRYYDEMFFHVLMACETTDVLFWNLTTHQQFDDDNATMNRLLDNFKTQLHGNNAFQCTTLDFVPYDSPVLITGVQSADGSRLYRVTLTPGKTTATITLPGETTPTAVTIPPGNAGAWVTRPARLTR